jgi:hypothetical protein
MGFTLSGLISDLLPIVAPPLVAVLVIVTAWAAWRSFRDP